MKLVLFEYVCESCGAGFKEPQINPCAYEEFLRRKLNSLSLRYLSGLAADAYEVAANELKINPATKRLSDVVQTKALQAIFGTVTCNFNADGDPFEMGLQSACSS